MTLRRRIATELALLTVLTIVFLVLFPERPAAVDWALALFALALVGWNVPFTRRVWAHHPAESGPGTTRRAYRLTLLVTAGMVAATLVLGASLAFAEGGSEAVAERLSNARVLLAVVLYLPWALLQQTLFQFYLLGRLRTLLPGAAAVVLTGVGYALVHLPDPWITAVTVLMGVFWTSVYDRFRTLLPIALSHATLGAAFYYWVYNKDLVGAWLAFLT